LCQFMGASSVGTRIRIERLNLLGFQGRGGQRILANAFQCLRRSTAATADRQRQLTKRRTREMYLGWGWG
jgi:hypothetical protein